jgi:hypothetical protein
MTRLKKLDKESKVIHPLFSRRLGFCAFSSVPVIPPKKNVTGTLNTLLKS